MIAGYATEEFAVPFPKLSDEQVEWIIQQVLAYIDRQRQTYRDSLVNSSEARIVEQKAHW
jgi:hypothetical protein